MTSITSRGKRWEVLHSLWIGWTFTLGFFNWVAFFYVAFRARKATWAVWGGIYAIPFALAMFVVDESFDGWIVDLTVALTFLMGIVGILHAFWIRKEYLLRLNHRISQRYAEDSALRKRVGAEYGVKDKSPKPLPFAEDARASSNDPTIESRKVVEKKHTSFIEKAKEQHKPHEKQKSKPIVLPANVMQNDDLEYLITSSYPFPLAFGFRTLSSIVDPRDLYRDQLRVAENILAYLASVSLAILQPEDYAKAKLDPKDFWMTGISPGDWKEIVALSSGSFARYEDDLLAASIKNLSIRSERKQTGFGANVMALIRAKNDYKHDRGPSVREEIATASEDVQESMRACLRLLKFFVDFPIRQVEDYDVARRGSGVVLKCLRYTGDHPSFAQEEISYERALPRGDLFIDRGPLGWTPLFPFITTMTCSHCKVRETYFIDAWDTRKGVARLKSFERGHTMISEEVAEALAEYSNYVRESAT